MRRVLSSVLIFLVLTACADKPRQPVTVFAASSLTGAFTDIGKAFERAHSDTKVTFNFASSSALARQITERASPDVFASADMKNITPLLGAKKVDVPVLFARNRLVIATKPKNPAHIKSLADLAHAGTVSLCAAGAPCGAYAAQALSRARVSIDESHVSRAPNVAAALSAVTDGDATAAVVYLTDAKAAGRRCHIVDIPDTENVIAIYPIARVSSSTHTAAARAFIAFVRGAQGRKILRRYGFLDA
ncbi:MAG: molybdate transport system substrate-binding protein [Actinomycetota bacterium]|jgi:molybdate transport system substrate-binding protein